MTTTTPNPARAQSDPRERSLAVAVLATGQDETPFIARSLHATTVDVLTPSGATLDDPGATATIAFSNARVEDYALLVLPAGPARARLQANPAAVEFVRAFARSGATPGAQDAGPNLMMDVGVNACGVTTAWQEVGPDIRDVSGTELSGPGGGGAATELPWYVVRLSSRIFEMILLSARHIP
jgi:putative intracellular protease/amidase